MLKNYPEAIENLDKVIEIDDKFTVAYMARAFAKLADAQAKSKSGKRVQMKRTTICNAVRLPPHCKT